MTKTNQTAYVAYLLRLWRDRGLRRNRWRASLENAETHDVRGFGNLEAVMAYLEEVMAEDENAAQGR